MTKLLQIPFGREPEGLKRNRETTAGREGEVNCPGGMASRLGIDLTKVLQESQPRGISSHLHYCWVYCKKVIVKTNDHSAEGRWSTFPIGSGINELDAPTTTSIERPTFAMPQIASFGVSSNPCSRLRVRVPKVASPKRTFRRITTANRSNDKRGSMNNH